MRAVAITFVLVSIVVLAIHPPVLVAGNWGGWKKSPGPDVLCLEADYRSECTPNNRTHTVFFSTSFPVPGQLRSTIEASIEDDYDALPNVTASVVTTNAADVHILYLTQSANWPIAYTTCQPGATTGYDNVRHYMWCRPQRIFYQTYPEAQECWDTGTCRGWLACHELGHTFGLQHNGRSTSCMSYSSNQPGNLDAHDKDHIAECFPRPTLPLPTKPKDVRTSACKTYE